MLNLAICAYMIFHRKSRVNEDYFKENVDLAFRFCAEVIEQSRPTMTETVKVVKDHIQDMATRLADELTSQIPEDFCDFGPTRVAYIKQIFEKYFAAERS